MPRASSRPTFTFTCAWTPCQAARRALGRRRRARAPALVHWLVQYSMFMFLGGPRRRPPAERIASLPQGVVRPATPPAALRRTQNRVAQVPRRRPSEAPAGAWGSGFARRLHQAGARRALGARLELLGELARVRRPRRGGGREVVASLAHDGELLLGAGLRENELGARGPVLERAAWSERNALITGNGRKTSRRWDFGNFSPHCRGGCRA